MPSKNVRPFSLNLEQYRDKVLGCWTGKNIGGTLGAPMEGQKTTNTVDFYVQDLQGEPAPNDDLDLQIAWLQAVEEHGLDRITPGLLGQYWLDLIQAGWNEYEVALINLKSGVQPPYSGVCCNEKWCRSNGAWIRSEIWACLAPGNPVEAARLAWADACVDHAGEGIYAEIFTTVVESAAFLLNDPAELVEIGLKGIPEDSRLAQSIRLVRDILNRGGTPMEAREAVVKLNEDMGMFQAPANVAFAVIGLLYGKGDFTKTICTAVNCGDDTDCTAATAGSIMGILLGRTGIPEKWTAPIGEGIKTIAICNFPGKIIIPSTLLELTERVVTQARIASFLDPSLPEFVEREARIPESTLNGIRDLQQIPVPNSYSMRFEFPKYTVEILCPDGLVAQPGKELEFEVHMHSIMFNLIDLCRIEWDLPEGWTITPGRQGFVRQANSSVKFRVTAGEFAETMPLLTVKVYIADRAVPLIAQFPVILQGAHDYLA